MTPTSGPLPDPDARSTSASQSGADGPAGPDERPAARPSRRVGGAAAVVLVLAAAGFLFAANAQLAGPGSGRHAQDLLGLVQGESARTQALADEVDALHAEVDALTDALAQQPEEPGEDRELTRFAAGRVPASGPGVTVRLTDAAPGGPRPDWVVNDDLVVHQQDLQAVINALWAGGAEAMGLQDQRVISTSAYRCVGNVLLLHGRTYSPPYEVRAIGDPVALEEALYQSPALQRYLEYVEAVGLGWSVTIEDEIMLPAFEGGLELQHARTLAAGGA
jgi:uncharacterized protein YlxW (UPF0749 family)